MGRGGGCSAWCTDDNRGRAHGRALAHYSTPHAPSNVQLGVHLVEQLVVAALVGQVYLVLVVQAADTRAHTTEEGVGRHRNAEVCRAQWWARVGEREEGKGSQGCPCPRTRCRHRGAS